ncbi:MAG: hypothetical protein ICV83_13660 [Cytophagales bacterium]|nr:hypothetical protein [Cytophagales bacterium]
MKESVLARTWIPNGILMLALLYGSVLTVALQQAEKWEGVLFLGVVFFLILLFVWYYRNKYDCLFKVTDSTFSVRYVNPLITNQSFAIAGIESNITVRRYIYREFMGGFPRLADYLNFRWYLLPEVYELSFRYQNEPVTITTQPNLIGLEKAMNKLVGQANRQIERDQPSQTVSMAIAKSLIVLVAADTD